jgi:hypothetical protein
MLYMTPELRRGLYAVDPQELGLDALLAQEAEEKEAEARAAAAAEAAQRRLAAEAAARGAPAPGLVTPDADIVRQLVDMGFHKHGSERAALACQQQGFEACVEWAISHSGDVDFETPSPLLASAHLEAAAEVVGSTGPTPEAGAGSGAKGKKGKGLLIRKIPLELQRLFAQLQLSDRRAISTDDLTKKVYKFLTCVSVHATSRKVYLLNLLFFPHTPPPPPGLQLAGGRRARAARRARAGAAADRRHRALPRGDVGEESRQVPVPRRAGLARGLPRVRERVGAERGLLRRLCQRPGEVDAGGAFAFVGFGC